MLLRFQLDLIQWVARATAKFYRLYLMNVHSRQRLIRLMDCSVGGKGMGSDLHFTHLAINLASLNRSSPLSFLSRVRLIIWATAV